MTYSPTTLIELPFGLPGRIFRSAMPFITNDPLGGLYKQYQLVPISVVVMLADDDECIREIGCDLRVFYSTEGLEVIYLPIPDYGVPSKRALDRALETTMEKANSARNIVIHCNGGIGRTGMFMACLARRVLGLSGEEAVSWVRERIPGAIETEEQHQVVLSC